MLHRTGKRSGTIHSINQISPKLAQIKHSVIPIPGDDGQVRCRTIRIEHMIL
jgi:hypothetical protein